MNKRFKPQLVQQRLSTLHSAWLAALLMALMPLAYGQLSDAQQMRMLEGQYVTRAVELDSAEQRQTYVHRLRPAGPAGGEKPMAGDALSLRYSSGLRGTPMLGRASGWCLTLSDVPLPTIIRPGAQASELLLDSCMGAKTFRRVTDSGKVPDTDSWALFQSQAAAVGVEAVWVSAGAQANVDYTWNQGRFKRVSRTFDFLAFCQDCNLNSAEAVAVSNQHGLAIKVGGFRSLTDQFFDNRGRTLASQYADAWVDYDDLNRPLRLRYLTRKPAGHSRERRMPADAFETIAEFRYDAEDRLDKISLAGFDAVGKFTMPFRARTWRFSYNDKGYLVALQSSLEDKPTEYAYDHIGRLAEVRWSTGERDTFFYWGDGHEAAGRIDPSGCVWVYGKVNSPQPDEHLILQRKQCPGEKPGLAEVRVRGMEVMVGDER